MWVLQLNFAQINIISNQLSDFTNEITTITIVEHCEAEEYTNTNATI